MSGRSRLRFLLSPHCFCSFTLIEALLSPIRKDLIMGAGAGGVDLMFNKRATERLGIDEKIKTSTSFIKVFKLSTKLSLWAWWQTFLGEIWHISISFFTVAHHSGTRASTFQQTSSMQIFFFWLSNLSIVCLGVPERFRPACRSIFLYITGVCKWFFVNHDHVDNNSQDWFNTRNTAVWMSLIL